MDPGAASSGGPAARPASAAGDRGRAAASRPTAEVAGPPEGDVASGAALTSRSRVGFEATEGGASRRRPQSAGGWSARASVDHIRRFRERRRVEEASFAREMEAQEKQSILAAQAKISQANLWAAQLGLRRSYQQRVIAKGDVSIGADVRRMARGEAARITYREMRVIIEEGEEAKRREISLEMFMREFRKLQHLVQHHGEETAAGAEEGDGSGGASAAAGGGASSAVSKKHGDGDGVMASTSASTSFIPHSLDARAGGMGAKRLSKEETMRELRRVLRETALLTHTLRQQVHELHAKGWNVGGRQTVPDFASPEVLRALEALELGAGPGADPTRKSPGPTG